MEEEIARADSRMNDGREEMKDERCAQHNARAGRVAKTRNEFGVDDAENERGNGDDEADQRAGRADVKKSARGADGRADEDESSQGAD